MIPRVAVPSRGRLRESVLTLLGQAGFPASVFHGSGARAAVDGIELIEMRPGDAAVWLAAGRISGAFLSTDIVLEEGIESLPTIALGLAPSDLVLASRDDDGRQSVDDLMGVTIATHLPKATAKWFATKNVDVTVVAMGGALEGVCAAGLADAIVDLRETGTSLAQNRLSVLAEIARCEALFVHDGRSELEDLTLRLAAVLEARRHRYVMLHLPPDRVTRLTTLFPGLAAPTILPLAGRPDLVAVHLVVGVGAFWAKLGALRSLGATGIVAVGADAIVP